MTNSSISTFYTSRASGLLRRPLTPSSTASSSEHGATVAHDSEVDDEDAGSQWKGSIGRGCEAQSPLQLFDKSLGSAHESGTLDGSSIADNEEMSSFFKNSELALEVEPKLEERVGNAEINWLSRDEAEDAEYLCSGDVKDGESHPAFDSRNEGSRVPAGLSKAVEDAGNSGNGVGAGSGSKPGSSSGLEKIRDKLRHLKSSTEAETEGEGVELAATRAHAVKCVLGSSTDALSGPRVASPTEGLVQLSGGEVEEVCVVCGLGKTPAGRVGTSERCGCRCDSLAGGSLQSQEGVCSRPFSGEGGSAKEEKTRGPSRAVDMVYGKERDVWYIYRQSSENGVPSAGASEAKMEVEAPEVRGMEADWRVKPSVSGDQSSRGRDFSPSAVSAQESSQVVREEIVPAVVPVSGDVGRVEVDNSIVQSEHGTSGQFSGECRPSGAGEPRSVPDAGAGAGGEGEDVTRMGYYRPQASRDDAGPGSEGKARGGMSTEIAHGVKACERVMQSNGEAENGKQNGVHQGVNEKSRDSVSVGEACKPVDMNHGVVEVPRTLAPQSSSVPHPGSVVNTESCVSESPTTLLITVHTRSTAEGGRTDVGASRDLSLSNSHSGAAAAAADVVWHAECADPYTPGKGRTRVAVDVVDIVREPASMSTESCAGVNSSEDASTVVAPSSNKARREDEVQCRDQTAARGAASDESMDERDCASHGDDDATFIDIPVAPREEVTAELGVPEAIYKQATHRGLLSESLQAEPVSIAGENPNLLRVEEVGRVDSENLMVEKYRTSADHDVWNSLKFPQSVHQSDREARKEREPTGVRRDGPGVRRFGSGVHAGCLSKSSSSKSSFRTPTSGSSIDLSRSTDTTSSCPSNASWEDPQYVGSKFWDSRPAPDVGRVSDASERAGAGLRSDSTAEQMGLSARGAGYEARVGEVASQNGEVQHCKREGPIHDADARCGVPFDEEASEEHFDYIFEYLGSKRDPSPKSAEVSVVSRVVPSSAAEESSGEGGTVRSSLPSGMSGERTSEANGGAMVRGKHLEAWTASKRESVEGSGEKCMVPGVSSSIETKVVTTQAASKEEIVESTVSPGSSTRKHLSSFKFSHRKSGDAELKRSATSKQASGSGNSQQQLDAGAPNGRSNGKANGKAAATPPHPQKGKSTRAGTPGRASGADAKARGPAQGANGEVAEELSIQSRFSNITVRSGSDPENFDWGRSSLEETSSRRGSSSGTNTAPVAVLRSTGASVRGGEDPGHGDAEPSRVREGEGGGEGEGEDEQQPRPNQFCPSRRSGETNSEASPSFEGPALCTSAQVGSMRCAAESRDPADANALEPGGWTNGDHLDERFCPESGVAHPMRPMRGSLNHAPKQNLDKLSEKLEQLETFGARVVLRNPQQQLMHSPRTDRKPPAGSGTQDCGRSTQSARAEKSSKQSKCRCTIM